MPVIGAIPIVMPTLTKIWKSSATTMPPGDDRREEVARDRDDPQPSPEHEQVERSRIERADEAALLAEGREREVGAVLGQEVELRLRRVVDAAAVHLARADGRDRLLDVVARVRRALSRDA